MPGWVTCHLAKSRLGSAKAFPARQPAIETRLDASAAAPDAVCSHCGSWVHYRRRHPDGVRPESVDFDCHWGGRCLRSSRIGLGRELVRALGHEAWLTQHVRYVARIGRRRRDLTGVPNRRAKNVRYGRHIGRDGSTGGLLCLGPRCGHPMGSASYEVRDRGSGALYCVPSLMGPHTFQTVGGAIEYAPARLPVIAPLLRGYRLSGGGEAAAIRVGRGPA